MLGPGGVTMIEFTDAWLAVAVDSDAAWESLKRVIADPRLDRPEYGTAAGRKDAQQSIDEVVAAWAAGRDADDAAAALQAAGVAASAVLTPLLVTADEHLLEREAFLPYSHPDAGDGRTTRPAWRFRRRPATTVRASPRFGEHSREVLGRVAGYSPADLDRMAATHVTTDDLIPTAAG
jgi:crotonobetainyl-CoA:carnitine CoA-transferase CaiB-like acyl-CoA transferase